MFQAGEVAPSCSRLLQLLTPIPGEARLFPPFCDVGDLAGLRLPEDSSPAPLPVLDAANVGVGPFRPYRVEVVVLLAFDVPLGRMPGGVL